MAILGLLLCGVLAGLFGGYLGVGGGIIMVPYLTLVSGLEIKAAIPISMSAIVVNSLASSSEYLRKGMVDVELVILLGTATLIGMLIGSSLLTVVPAMYVKLLLAGVIIYTAITFAGGKEKVTTGGSDSVPRRHMVWCSVLSLLGGVLASIVGMGGGVIVIPLMFLVIGVPLTVARGTSSFIVGISGAASVAIHLINGMVDFSQIPPVMLGTLLGGKLGGSLGTVAKPVAVKILFVVVLLYISVRLGWEPIQVIFR